MMKMEITKESRETTLHIDLRSCLYSEMAVLGMFLNALTISFKKKLP